MARFLFILALMGGILYGTWYFINQQQWSKNGGIVLPAPTGTRVTSLSDIGGDPERFIGKVVHIEGTVQKETLRTPPVWYITDDGGAIQLLLPGKNGRVDARQEGKKVRATGTIYRSKGELVLVYAPEE